MEKGSVEPNKIEEIERQFQREIVFHRLRP